MWARCCMVDLWSRCCCWALYKKVLLGLVKLPLRACRLDDEVAQSGQPAAAASVSLTYNIFKCLTRVNEMFDILNGGDFKQLKSGHWCDPPFSSAATACQRGRRIKDSCEQLFLLQDSMARSESRVLRFQIRGGLKEPAVWKEHRHAAQAHRRARGRKRTHARRRSW